MSQTKAITSIAVLQLIERGLVSLDTPVSDILTEMRGLQVLTGFDSSGQPILRAPRRMPTIRDLLTHTAGFVYDAFDKTLDRYMRMKGLRSIRKADMLKAPLRHDPGTKWE